MKEMHSQYRNLKCGINRARPSFLAPIHVNLWECSGGQSLAIHFFSKWLISTIWFGFIHHHIMSCAELQENCANVIAISWSQSRMQSTHNWTGTKTLNILAETTALASPAPVHRGKTPLRCGQGKGPAESDEPVGPVVSGASASSVPSFHLDSRNGWASNEGIRAPRCFYRRTVDSCCRWLHHFVLVWSVFSETTLEISIFTTSSSWKIVRCCEWLANPAPLWMLAQPCYIFRRAEGEHQLFHHGGKGS